MWSKAEQTNVLPIHLCFLVWWFRKKKNPQQYYQSKVGHNVPAQKGSGLAINFLWQLSWWLQAVLVYTLNCRNLMKWLTTIFLSKKYFSSLKHMVLSFKNSLGCINLNIHGINRKLKVFENKSEYFNIF